MARQSKYIIFEVHGGLEVPVIFNPVIEHKSGTVAGGKPVAAGFCILDVSEEQDRENYSAPDKSFSCWGESISLKLKSRKQDPDILNKYIEYDC